MPSARSLRAYGQGDEVVPVSVGPLPQSRSGSRRLPVLPAGPLWGQSGIRTGIRKALRTAAICCDGPTAAWHRR